MESCYIFIPQVLSGATLVSSPFGYFLCILDISTQACIFYICVCHSYFSCCCDKYPYKSSLIKKSLIWPHGARVQSTKTEKSRQQGFWSHWIHTSEAESSDYLYSTHCLLSIQVRIGLLIFFNQIKIILLRQAKSLSLRWLFSLRLMIETVSSWKLIVLRFSDCIEVCLEDFRFVSSASSVCRFLKSEM